MSEDFSSIIDTKKSTFLNRMETQKFKSGKGTGTNKYAEYDNKNI